MKMQNIEIKKPEEIAKALRYFGLQMTTQAGSGHPSSALSAADLMVALLATTWSTASLKELAKKRITIDVIDCYSIKPIDEKTIRRLAKNVGKVVIADKL